jgi:hypothetical protein
MVCQNRRTSAEADAWREFQRKLADAGLMREAWALVEDGPPKNAPGSVYYLNLGAFLEDFRAPDSSSPTERILYAEFVERLVMSGVFRPDLAAPILVALHV